MLNLATFKDFLHCLPGKGQSIEKPGIVMSIGKYAPYFHDGLLVDVDCKDNGIEFSMSSAEMDPEDLKEDLRLASDDTLKGRLHIEGVVSFKISGDINFGNIFKPHDRGTILNLEINDGLMKMDILWVDYPPKPSTSYFLALEIGANKIWWENIPDLTPPLW